MSPKEWLEKQEISKQIKNDLKEMNIKNFIELKEAQRMNKVVIELDEQYKPLVEDIKTVEGVPSDEYYKIHYQEYVEKLSMNWFGNNLNIIKTLERIHSADEIKFVSTSEFKFVNNEVRYETETEGCIVFNSLQVKALKYLFDKWEAVEV